MTAAQPHMLNDQWKRQLDLSSRGIPDFYETTDSVRDTPHAGAIRLALDDLGLSAVFCVQGVPTIAILSTDEYDRASVIDLHAALWNQGLASLLLVISGEALRSFSLSRKPYADLHEEFDQRCLIETLDATTDAIALRNLIYGAESGRLWMEKTDYFRQGERIDQVLLDNLTESYRSLCGKNLSSDAAQALLIQAMFIAYLEDRKILTQAYFLDISRDGADSFSALLERGDVGLLDRLFKKLRQDFKGDLFAAPCSFEQRDRLPSVNRSHLEILARFRSLAAKKCRRPLVNTVSGAITSNTFRSNSSAQSMIVSSEKKRLSVAIRVPTTLRCSSPTLSSRRCGIPSRRPQGTRAIFLILRVAPVSFWFDHSNVSASTGGKLGRLGLFAGAAFLRSFQD